MKEQLVDRNLELMSKYLGKELTESETLEFAKWLEESELNRKELEKAEKIWQYSSLEEMQLFDTDKGWNKMQNRVNNGKVIQSAIRKHIILNVLKFAASIIILMTLAFAVYRIVDNLNYVKVTAGRGKILKPILLPDGSEVCLNSGSILRYPKTFKNKVRRIELTGEAFFNIVPNKMLPFIIQTPHAQVKVLGTSFNVTDYKECDSVEVVVETGIVEFSSRKASEHIQLTKGNTGVYFTYDDKMVKHAVSDANAFAWKTNEIIFHESNLEYVSKTLKKVFSKAIIFDNDNLKKCRLNADFKNRDLESILEVIKETFNIEVKKTSNGYILDGAGC